MALFELQLVLLYVLLGGVAIAALTATTIAYRRFYTSAQQIDEGALG
jgi:ABC-type iron transport system FetAB permease component